MTASARATANVANASASTGPRTGEGKARSSRNAVKHGLNGGQDLEPSVLAGDRLLVRNDNEMAAFRLSLARSRNEPKGNTG